MKRACLLALTIVLAAPAVAHADTTTVDPNASGCTRGQSCKLIQDAVTASMGGDTIKILPGTYAENVSVPSGKDGLTLTGGAGVLISGVDGGSNLSVASAGVTATGLTLIKAAGADPALNATGGKLTLADAVILATGGDAVAMSGADNVIQRSTLATLATTAGADGIAFTTGGLRVDSSVVLGGGKGAAFRVTTTDGSGAATVTLDHVSTTGAGAAVALEGAGGGVPVPLMPVGDITFNVNASILHGAATAVADIGGVLSQPAANTVKATYVNSDADKMTVADGATSTGSGNPTPDSALFRPGTLLRLKPDAPVVDKGGSRAAEESDTDIDGDPRTNGAFTDIGADEFTNHPPTLDLTVTPDAPKTGQVVTATGKATDPEGATDIKGYAVDWGDGTKNTSVSNVVQHVYAKAGTYTVTMVVADQSFATSAPVTKTITLTDGQPPQLQLTTPAAGSTVRLGKGKKRKPLTIKGVDADDSGLATVEIALTKKGSTCKQYTGSKLKRASCTKFTFLKAKLSGNGFKLTTKKKLKLPKGSYEARVRATDVKGNATTTFDKTTKTLVAFKIR